MFGFVLGAAAVGAVWYFWPKIKSVLGGVQLIANWKTELHRLWSIRLSLFVGVMNGIVLALTAFSDVFNPWFFLGVNALFNIALIPLSRLVKQAETVKP